MTKQEVFEYVLEQYGTEPDYPWMDENAVLRHEISRKWYGLVMNVRRDRLGLDGDGSIDVMNVKLDPILIGTLRTQEGYLPAYHMSKSGWLTIRLDGTAPEEEIKQLIDMSYDLTKTKCRKK